MRKLTFLVFFFILFVPFGGVAGAQASGKAPSPEQAIVPAVQPIPLAAYANSLPDTLVIDAPEAPTKADLAAGVLLNAEHPALHIVPMVEMGTVTKTDKGWVTPITVTGMIPFGDSDISIYFKNKKVDTLHILKNGIALESMPAVQQQNDPLLLVLQNPTGFAYTSVRARLRFKDRDVCVFQVERFPDQKDAPTTPEPVGDCDQVTGWTSFQIPQYAGVSLRATPLRSWFVDDGTGFSRAAKQKGTLTLRFFAEGKNGHQEMVQEQVLPVEIQFQPSTLSHSFDFFKVGFWLLVGAAFSVLLRVAIPNYRRLRVIKESLLEIRKTTRGISEQVDSMLRVQLRVERLTLDTLRKSEVVFSPGFSAVASRVEAAAATLKRRIEFVRRLDAALNRKRLLVVDELAPPSRIATIDRHLTAASEELKSDQFREEDWVFIQHTLETADKNLSAPSEEEKAAFETLLVQRWKGIAKHFAYVPGTGWMNIPPSLMKMAFCFPDVNALPGADDPDGSMWIKTIGTVRADLQITALELIREFQFLAPAQITDHWDRAMMKLTPWLATPALENLNEAQSYLRQLSEGVDPEHIIAALQSGGAQIELDPQSVGSGERVHLAVRFWSPNLNTAAARQQIICEWHFQAFEGVQQSGTPQVDLSEEDEDASSGAAMKATLTGSAGVASVGPGPAGLGATTSSQPGSALSSCGQPSSADTLFYRERGWDIYHYFESVSKRCPLEVLFYFDGKPVLEAGSKDPLMLKFVIDLEAESAARKKTARKDVITRTLSETLELFAVLLVPLCALAVSTADQGSSGHWWQLLGLGFGSDTIRNVLSGATGATPPKS